MNESATTTRARSSSWTIRHVNDSQTSSLSNDIVALIAKPGASRADEAIRANSNRASS